MQQRRNVLLPPPPMYSQSTKLMNSRLWRRCYYELLLLLLYNLDFFMLLTLALQRDNDLSGSNTGGGLRGFVFAPEEFKRIGFKRSKY